LLTRHCRTAAAGEQPKALIQARGDLLCGQRLDPRRRELERERNPVEPSTDLHDR
jgi:hypothetical protein